MLSLVDELNSMRDRGALEPRRAETLLRIERRELLSVHYELRVVVYAAVAMIATAVGAVLKKNLDRIGPITIALILAAAAAGLYAWGFARMRRNSYSLFDDYLMLLAALLVSADVGYVEQQFDLLGENGFDHLVILAAVHAAFAYALGSRLILAVSITSLAAWFGIDRHLETLFDAPSELGRQALICAVLVAVWRWLHGRFSRVRRLDRTFEHFAVNLAGFGATAYVSDDSLEALGLVLLALFVVSVTMLAVKRHSELFLLYTLFHAISGISVSVTRHVEDDVLITLYFLFVFSAAIVTLFAAHMRWRFDE